MARRISYLITLIIVFSTPHISTCNCQPKYYKVYELDYPVEIVRIADIYPYVVAYGNGVMSLINCSDGEVMATYKLNDTVSDIVPLVYDTVAITPNNTVYLFSFYLFMPVFSKTLKEKIVATAFLTARNELLIATNRTVYQLCPGCRTIITFLKTREDIVHIAATRRYYEYIAVCTVNNVVFINRYRKKALWTMEVPEGVRYACVSSSGGRIMLLTGNENIVVLNYSNMDIIARINLSTSPRKTLLSDDGKYVAVVYDDRIDVYKVVDKTIVWSMSFDGNISSCDFSYNFKVIAVSLPTKVYIFRNFSAEPVMEFNLTEEVTSLDLRYDGSILVFSHGNKVVQVNTLYRKKSSISISIEKSRIEVNEITHIEGYLNPPLRNQTLIIETSFDGTNWRSFGTIVTGKNGHFKQAITYLYPVTIYFRVVWYGNEEYEGCVSSPVKLEVVKRRVHVNITITSAEEAYLNSEIEIKGETKPKLINEALRLNVTSPSGKSYEYVVQTDNNGRFTFKIKLDEKGEWKIYAKYWGSEDYLPSTSNIITIRAKEREYVSEILPYLAAVIAVTVIAIIMVRKKLRSSL